MEIHTSYLPVHRYIHWLRTVYVLIAWLLVGCIVTQVFLAGLNVFLQPRYWALHIQFGHIVGLIVIVLLLLGVAARLPRRMHALALLMVLLIAFQYNARRLAALFGVPELAALHAVNALILFWCAATLSRWARRSDRSQAA